MRLLADENFPLKSVLYLRSKGFDIRAIGVDNPSISDRQVVSLAIEEKRTILTFDRDYGELIFKHRFKPEQGVIYLRFDDYSPDEPGVIVENLLSNNKIKFDNTLTVVDRLGVRQRKY